MTQIPATLINGAVLVGSNGPFGASSPYVYTGNASNAGISFAAGSNPFDFKGIDSWTVDMWFYPQTFHDDYGAGTYLLNVNAPGVSNDVAIRLQQDTGLPQFSSGTSNSFTIQGTVAPNLNAWNHIRVCVTGSLTSFGASIWLYLNGKLSAVTTGREIDHASVGLIANVGSIPGYYASRFNTGEIAVFYDALNTVATNTTLETQVFTPPTTPWANSLNKLGHLYHWATVNDTADQNFLLPTVDTTKKISIVSSGGNDTITIPAGMGITGTYPITSAKLYRGLSPGAELDVAVATLNATSGTFPPVAQDATRPTWYTVKFFDNEPVPAPSLPTNEVASIKGAPLIGSNPLVTRPLRRTYKDDIHQKVTFGLISFYMLGFRGFLDTAPAKSYEYSLGLNLGSVDINNTNYQRMITQYKDAGFGYIRIGSSWGSDVDYTGHVTSSALANYKNTWSVFKNLGVRPLILFDMNNGNPVPSRTVNVNVVTAASQGATSLVIDNTNIAQVRPFYASFGFGTPRLVSAISGPDGSNNYTLTIPGGLPSAIGTGTFGITDLKYSPLGSDGSGPANARAAETFAGYAQYVKEVCQAAYAALGTLDDAGFDIEVLNEIFGISGAFGGTGGISAWGITGFSAGNAIYSGQSTLSTGFSYANSDGYRGAATDVINNLGYKNVVVVNGCGNGSPYVSGDSLWPGEGAHSRHSYTGGIGDVSVASPLSNSHDWAVIDALGAMQGTLNGTDWGTITPGTNFIPTFRQAWPEQHFTFLGGTESLIREVGTYSQPLAYGYGGHGRFAQNPKNIKPYKFWETESNYERSDFRNLGANAAGVSHYHPVTNVFSEQIVANVVLRLSLMSANKGAPFMSRIYWFCMTNNNAEGNTFELTPTGYDTSKGPSLVPQVVKRTKDFLTLGDTPFGVPRYLDIGSVVEYDPQVVWTGDGANPNGSPTMYNADFLALLPYQTSASRFVVAAYVAHPDMTKAWDTSKGVLDINRYIMTPQGYDITINNVQGNGAGCRLYDPSTDTYEPVTIKSRTYNSITVNLGITNRPRLLEITESQDGPIIKDFETKIGTNGNLNVQWASNAPVTLTYGADTSTRESVQLVPDYNQGKYSLSFAPSTYNTVRITANLNGVTTKAPYYDNDIQGQRTYSQTGKLSNHLYTDAIDYPVKTSLSSETFSNVIPNKDGVCTLDSVVYILNKGVKISVPADVRTLLINTGSAVDTA